MIRAPKLAAFERRTAIYNAVCDLQGERLSSATAWTEMQRRFPDITKEEFLRATKTFNRVSSIMCAYAEEGGSVFTPEVESEIDAIVTAYASGEAILEH